MVDVSISRGNLVLNVHGVDKLWALKSSLEIPIEHVIEIRTDPAAARGWWHGIRMPGTNIPGVLTAGTFYQNGKRVFWDVHNPDEGRGVPVSTELAYSIVYRFTIYFY
jgi:hypothetical protein